MFLHNDTFRKDYLHDCTSFCLVYIINQGAILYGCLLSSMHTGRVPVQWPHSVQFRLAEPNKVKPSLHENSCSSPILNHCFLGQNWPLSNWSCAGQRMSEKVRKIETVIQRECIKPSHNSYLNFQNHGLKRQDIFNSLPLHVAVDTVLPLGSIMVDHSPLELQTLVVTG